MEDQIQLNQYLSFYINFVIHKRINLSFQKSAYVA